MMTGRKVLQSGEKLAAAKEIVKKAVFCVDNLNTSVTVDDLRKHVARLCQCSVMFRCKTTSSSQ